MSDNPFMSAPIEEGNPSSPQALEISANPFLALSRVSEKWKKKRYAIGVAALSVLGAAGYICVVVYQNSVADNAAWEQASSDGSREALAAYIKSYPSGKHAEHAQMSLGLIESGAWAGASATGTTLSLNSYLTAYPSGKYVADARKALDRLDDAAWRIASAADEYEPIKRYLAAYPSGRHSAEARNALEKKVACTRAYAEAELRSVSSLTESSGTGASNIYNTYNGTPYSRTEFDGGSALTYYYDGAYTRQDAIEVSYRISNNSRYLVYKEVSGVVSYRTRAGSLGWAALGALLGAAACADADSGAAMLGCAAVGAGGGYAVAEHSRTVTLTPNIYPGQSYNGSAYVSSSWNVSGSSFSVTSIKAVISEPEITSKLAHGC